MKSRKVFYVVLKRKWTNLVQWKYIEFKYKIY